MISDDDIYGEIYKPNPFDFNDPPVFLARSSEDPENEPGSKNVTSMDMVVLTFESSTGEKVFFLPVFNDEDLAVRFADGVDDWSTPIVIAAPDSFEQFGDFLESRISFTNGTLHVSIDPIPGKRHFYARAEDFLAYVKLKARVVE